MLFSVLDSGLFSSKYCRAHLAMSLELRRAGWLESLMLLLSSSWTLGVFKASAASESSAASAITNLPNSIVQLFLGLSSNFSCAWGFWKFREFRFVLPEQWNYLCIFMLWRLIHLSIILYLLLNCNSIWDSPLL